MTKAHGIGKTMHMLMVISRYLKSFIIALSPEFSMRRRGRKLPVGSDVYQREVYFVKRRLVRSAMGHKWIFIVLIAISLVTILSSCTANQPGAHAGEVRPDTFWQKSITQLDLLFTFIAWTIGLVLVVVGKRALPSIIGKSQNLQSVVGPTLVYICLHLEKQESLRTVKLRMDRAIGKPLNNGLLIENLVLACDLIATPDQISDGHAQHIAGEIIQYLDSHYPDLRGRFVGISDDEHLRPMRDGVISGALALGDVDNVHQFVFE